MTDVKKDKFRYFAFLVYFEDKDGNKTEIEQLSKKLRETWGDFLISPLHQPDDEVDSLHYHVIYKHPGPATIEAVRKVIGEFAYNGFILALHHPRNYQRYLLHLDNPEKEQFPPDSLTVVNNFPVDISKDLTIAEKYEIQMDIEELITEYTLTEYKTVTDVLRRDGDIDHYIYFTTHTHHFTAYLNSYRNSLKSEKGSQND